MVLIKIANVKEIVFIDKSNKWFHTRKFFKSGITSTRDINHTRRWFHKWSSTLSDHQMKNASLTTKSEVYQIDDPWNDLGGGVPPIGIKVKDPMCGSQELYKWCHSNTCSGVHKKMQHSRVIIYPNASLCINKKHTFYENWWKRGRDYTKIWKLCESLRQRSRGWTWTWIKRKQHWGLRRIKILDKRSTQVGGASSWTCVWLHLICAYSCACLHCISF